jgi:hypothetical protein
VRQSEPIDDYLSALAREISFDPALSRRVRCEAEDHLWQAAEVRGGPSVENQRLAILDFGEARELARGYVAASILAQIRWAGGAMILAAAAIYVAMKARVAWYGWIRWEPTPDYTAVSAFALPIDHYATMLALICALIGCAYIATRRAPSRADRSYRKQLNRCIVLCGASATALSFCVATEVVLTGVGMSETQWCAATAVPVLSLLVEIAAVIGFALSIRTTIRRTEFAASLLRD